MVQAVERPRAARAPRASIPASVTASSAIDDDGGSRIKWTHAEWRSVAEALQRLFPELGLLGERASIGRVGLRHMRAAIETALEPARRRDMRAMTLARPRLTEQFDLMREEAVLAAQAAQAAQVALAQAALTSAARPCPPAKTDGVVPDLSRSAIIVAQPDGPHDGAPQSRIFWKPNELRQLAIEMLHRDPNSPYLETLIDLRGADVYDAQRVLPSSRRRDRSSLPLNQLRAQLAPVFQQLRSELAAERRVQIAAEQADQARRAAEQEAREQAEREAARQKLIREAEEAALERPDFVQRVLEKTTTPELLIAAGSRLGAIMKGVIAESIVVALADPRLQEKFAPHMGQIITELGRVLRDRDAAAHHRTAPESAPRKKKLKVCIIGMHKSNHFSEVRNAFGDRFDLRLVHPDESLQLMKDRARGADRVLLLTEQIGHEHSQALDSAKIQYEPVLGSIGKLKDYLAKIEIPD